MVRRVLTLVVDGVQRREVVAAEEVTQDGRPWLRSTSPLNSLESFVIDVHDVGVVAQAEDGHLAWAVLDSLDGAGPLRCLGRAVGRSMARLAAAPA